jgi:hypothetical protein
MKFHPSLLLACCLAAAFPAANAAEPTTTTVGTSENTEAKLSAEFAAFLGGETQAHTVINGLRQGTAFDLVTQTTMTDPATGQTTTTTTTTTIDPPTGTMGYGNVRIALRLAQAELGELGITQPTPEQLSAILLGGTINSTQVDGILAMRADGMGWGQIAQHYGTTVGQLMGKGAGLTKQTTATTQAKTTGKATTTANQAAKQAPATQAKANGYIPTGKGTGTGIVTGTGSTASAAGSENGKGQAAVKAGQTAATTGLSHANGGASSTAPGQVKKN